MAGRGDPLGYFEGEKDPGCKRYYARMKEYHDTINAILLPCGGRVSYVGKPMGSILVIWYWGKTETGFASGLTPEDVVESIYGKVFGGL